MLPVASICFILCYPAWFRAGGNDIAALDNRRFGSALSAAADRAACLQRIAVIFLALHHRVGCRKQHLRERMVL